jgi:hypothetical protein
MSVIEERHRPEPGQASTFDAARDGWRRYGDR